MAINRSRDTSGRSLGADDIEGAYALYQVEEVPEPDVDPPVMVGTAEFGEDCGVERRVESLFCLNDGRDLYCSKNCTPGDDSCGDGYCAICLVEAEGPACEGKTRGNLAAFGEVCGEGWLVSRGWCA